MPSTPGHSRQSLLVADDNPINQQVMQAMLEEEFDLVVVEDGIAAVRECQAQTFAAVLMDVHMPRMDGVEACEIISSMGADAPPVIAITADAEFAMKHPADASLFAAVVVKPFTVRDLFLKVMEIIAESQAAQPSGLKTGSG